MKKIIFITLVGIATIITFIISRNYAIQFRGTTAIGGEITILAAPFILWIIYDAVKDLVEIIRDIKLSKQAEEIEIAGFMNTDYDE